MSTPTYKQANRPVRISTPLEEDVLLLRSMTGVEKLGRLFEYELVLLSEKHDVDYKEIIGKNVTVSVDKGDKDNPRYFNGIISRFGQANYEKRLVEYRAKMVPWLWLLSRSADCRIFQTMSVPDILKQIFTDHGFSDVIFRLHGTYKPWEYCVQYRESTFDFVSRLMEQEGIYYFFKHENGKHTLVLCDTPGSHLEFKGYEELKFRLPTKEPLPYESLWSWVEHHEVQPGGFLVKDFDFKKPRRTTVSSAILDRSHAGSQFERFDYLGEMDAECDGERYSKLRLEEWQASHELYTGEGDARGVCTGVRFTLRGHPRKDFEKEYLTVGTEFKIESDPFETVQEAKDEFVYEAKLTAIPVSEQFRSPRMTSKPLIQGPQTAMVVGIKGEEIHTDKYGRVKVQFHWDRYGKADENSSCWVRVAQVWAGKQWGAIYTPRVGQEVIIEFLEGDPDRPIVTGRVYNEVAMPPHDLPDNKTISTLKSNSSKGGQGFNEIRFEDNKGKEQLFFHAEKDQEIRVKNDVHEWIGNDQHLSVKKDQFIQIEGKANQKIKGNSLSEIEGDLGEKVKGAHHAQIEGVDHLIIKGDHCVQVDGDVSQKYGKNLNHKTAQKISLESGQDAHIKAGTTYAVEAGTTIHIKGGTTVVIEGGTQLSLKAGPSFIDIGASGVAISGPMVKVNSGGAAASGGGCAVTAPMKADPPDPPAEAKEAIKATPGEQDEPPPAPEAPKPVKYSSAALALKSAANDGTPFCEECARAAEEEAQEKSTWVEFQLVGEDGHPVADEPYRVTLPDGTVEEGNLDDDGKVRVDKFARGDCKITFPNLDQEAWEEA